MKIKRSDLIVLKNAFKGMLEDRMNPELAFKIASNVIVVSEGAEKIRKAYKPVDGFKAYESERNKLIVRLGTPTGDGKHSFLPKQAAEFNKLQVDLDEKHADVLKEQAEYTDEFNKMLDKKIELNIERINLKELTADIDPAKLVIMIKSGVIHNECGKGDV